MRQKKKKKEEGNKLLIPSNERIVSIDQRLIHVTLRARTQNTFTQTKIHTHTHTLLLYIWSFWRQSLGANKITVK